MYIHNQAQRYHTEAEAIVRRQHVLGVHSDVDTEFSLSLCLQTRRSATIHRPRLCGVSFAGNTCQVYTPMSTPSSSSLSLSLSLSLYCEELISVCYYLATAEFLPVLSKDSSIRIILRCTRHHRVASSLFRRRCRNRTDQSYQENTSSIFPRELMSPDTEIQ